MKSSSESFFQRTLNQKTELAREAVQKCVWAFLSESPRHRQPAANEAFQAVERISEMLHPGDWPPWLSELLNSLKSARDNHNDASGATSIQNIASRIQNELNSHVWNLGGDQAMGVDFDALFKKYNDQNRIPELFDKIISALTEIATSGHIDRVSVLKELDRIIATLKNARNGSYFATRSAWFFVATWFKNSSWELFGDIPLLGAPVRGLRDALKEMDAGMNSLHQQVQGELQEQISQDFPRLEYQSPEIPKLEFTQLN